MDESKADWEVWLDDSHQWGVGKRVALMLTWACLILQLFWNSAWFVGVCVFTALGLGLLLRERYMVNKAVQLRLKEAEEDGE